MPIICIIILILFVLYKIYEIKYYKGNKFLSIKNRIHSYVIDCNNLNQHIQELNSSNIGTNQLERGVAIYSDNSKYNYKRKKLSEYEYSQSVYNCSKTIVSNARDDPFKYICKYFNIKANEETLEKFEKRLNELESVEAGKISLKNEKANIINGISAEVPFLIKYFSKKKFEKKLGFDTVSLEQTNFDKYIFKYVSSGGNASLQCDIVMDIKTLNSFINYLSEKIKFNKSMAGQRALMTSSLRKKIMERDKYTCKMCGNSILKEPNLLLEIDHILPLSKGGLTVEDNLQTLCWRCNRSKGAKIILSGQTSN